MILLAAAAALVLPSACYADDLPAPIVSLEATGATSTSTTGSISGTTTNIVVFGGTQTSTATAAYGLGDASVSANGSTVGGLNTAVSSAHAVVLYYVEAVQTGSTPVPVSQVPLIFSGSVTTTASGIQASASASFETPAGAINACSSSTGPCGFPSASNSGTFNYNALAGTIYDIEVNAGGGSGVGSGTYFASADPEVEIDPSFAYASDFTVEFSPGPTSSGGGGTNPPPSVPEPSNLALLSVALPALLGLTAICKRLGAESWSWVRVSESSAGNLDRNLGTIGAFSDLLPARSNAKIKIAGNVLFVPNLVKT